MITIEINPKAKMLLSNKLYTEINNNPNNTIEYMSTPGILSDHEVFFLNQDKIHFNHDLINNNTDYVMLIELCKQGLFGPYQAFNLLVFNEDEIDIAAKINGIFSADEIRYMEAFEHWDEE